MAYLSSYQGKGKCPFETPFCCAQTRSNSDIATQYIVQHFAAKACPLGLTAWHKSMII